MLITQAKLRQEIYRKTGFTPTELKIVFDAFREVMVEHMRNLDAVKLFAGITIFSKKTKPKSILVPSKKEWIVSKPRITVKLHVTEEFIKLINYRYEY